MDLNSSGPEVLFMRNATSPLWLRALVMKTTLLDHLSLGPYKESVTSVQIQMPFHAVGRLRAALVRNLRARFQLHRVRKVQRFQT